MRSLELLGKHIGMFHEKQAPQQHLHVAVTPEEMRDVALRLAQSYARD